MYVGIAPIQLILKDGENEDNASALTLFEIFTSPQKNDLEDGKEYALVMNRLDDRWQLSNLLPKALANRKGMEVLAQHIARMHRRLSKDPRDLANALQIGNKDKLLEKLNLNKDLFLEALEVLSLPEEEENRYTGILPILFSAFANYQNDFIQREETQHIKRCHGDLKAPNLWLYPVEKGMTDLLKYKTCLLALDCIDFMPEFCHIDTLSDIAMLAIDIELYSMNGAEKVEDGSSEKSLATYFLETYLKQAQEQHLNVWRLLNYYMVEKAMIGMYGNILNDKQVEVGKRYLHLAYKHVMNLQLL